MRLSISNGEILLDGRLVARLVEGVPCTVERELNEALTRHTRHIEKLEKLPPAERIVRAKAKMKRVVDHFLYLVQLHENNVCIVYSPGLSSQIPKSFAANAFNIFQRGCHEVEIVRLCALWDKFDRDGENILTVVDLIDSPCVLDMLSEDMRQFWRNSDLGCRDELRKAIKSAKEIKDSSKLDAVMNLRHKHLAHSFAQTRREKTGTVFQPIEPGDETELLEEFIPIVEALFTWVNGVSLSIAECREFRRKNAHALWTGCTFTNLR